MAASSSQSMQDSNKHEPGKLMRLILQAKDQNSSQSMPMEKKEPEKDLNWYLPLYKAALKGDWKSAREFFDQDPEAVTAKITKVSETALHIAAGTGKAINFMKELLELIPVETLPTLQDQAGQTALHYAAIFGNVEAAQLLVKKNPALANSASNTALLPIHLAAGYANKDLVSYLLTVTRDDIEPNPFTDKSGVELLNLVIVAEFYDLALYLIQLYPKLATMKSPGGNSALSMIAGKPLSFQGGRWGRFIYSFIPVKSGIVYKRTTKEGSDNPAFGCQNCLEKYCCVQSLRKLKFSGCQKLHATFWTLIEHLVPYVKSIRDTKLMHQRALQLVRRLCLEVAEMDYSTA